MKEEKYYIQLLNGPWQEVSLEDYIKAEREAGFHGPDGEPATSSFSSGVISGHMGFLHEKYEQD